MGTDNLITRRKLIGVTAAAVGAALLTSCSKPQAGPEKATAVVFYSQTGNTAGIAAHIAEHLNAETFELKAAQPYTDDDFDYDDPTKRAAIEQNAPETRPKLAEIPDLQAFDTVFLGYPIWFSKAPRVLCTFVEGCDLSGKTIVPFCTSDSSGIGSSAEELAGIAAPTATWLPGMRFAPGTDSKTVAEWIDSLSLE